MTEETVKVGKAPRVIGGSGVVPPLRGAPESSRDPLAIMLEIVKDPGISDDDKSALIQYSRERFRNRRSMAYAALYTMIVTFILIFLAAFIDGMTDHAILASLSEISGLVGTMEGFLAAIVGTYYGVSAWRPSS